MPPTIDRADPGGVFASDVHRRVLGHLPTPDADYGYELQPLLARIAADPITPIPAEPVDLDLDAELDALDEVLAELAEDGYAKSYKGGVWRMTKLGLEKLTGPADNPDEPGAAVVGPAVIDQLSTVNMKATGIGS